MKFSTLTYISWAQKSKYHRFSHTYSTLENQDHKN